jgi:hypothetical protein
MYESTPQPDVERASAGAGAAKSVGIGVLSARKTNAIMLGSFMNCASPKDLPSIARKDGKRPGVKRIGALWSSCGRKVPLGSIPPLEGASDVEGRALCKTHRLLFLEKENEMRKVAIQLISFLTVAGLACPVPALAAFPALSVQTRKTRLPFNQCVSQTRSAAAQSGLLERANFGDSTAGHTATARAHMMCVPLPSAGPCHTTGAQAVFIAASTVSFADAKALTDRMSRAFGDPQLIDCG